MNRLKALAIAATLFIASLPATAQEPSAAENKFTVRSNLVFLPTRVQTKKGETIYGLKPEDFIVEDNGVRQSVHVDEDPDVSGLSLVVVVQCGRSSPAEFSKLKGLRAMIDKIAGAAPHEVAIISYGEGPYVLGDFSRSSGAVRLALSRLKPCGEYYAASIDAVYYAMNMLKRRQNHYRRAILLIGETRDHGSRSKLNEVVGELGVTDTTIYTVAFAAAKDEVIEELRHPVGPPTEFVFPPPPSSPEADASPPAPPGPIFKEHTPLVELPPQLMLAINALRQNSASELASLSGGEYQKFTTQQGFEQGLQRISDQLHNYYLLSFAPPSGPAWGFHTLRVRIADRPDAVVQTRRSYWAGIFESPTDLR